MTKHQKKKEKDRKEGYKVGVFKHGKLKHIMDIKQSVDYLKEKKSKLKKKEAKPYNQKPKRECSPAQLEALARGRAARDANQKMQKKFPTGAAKPRMKNQMYAKESKSHGGHPRGASVQLRRQKEMHAGKHRSHESQYNSDSDHDLGRRSKYSAPGDRGFSGGGVDYDIE